MSGSISLKLPLRKEAGYRIAMCWWHLRKAGCELRDAVKVLFVGTPITPFLFVDASAVTATNIMPATIPAEHLNVSDILVTGHIHVPPVDVNRVHYHDNLISTKDQEMPPVTTLGLGDDTTSKKKPAKKKKSPAKKKK